MGWLDELKKSKEFLDSIDRLRNPQYGHLFECWNDWHLDRLIEIAEGAHKHMDEPCYPYCPICGGYGKQVGEVDGHGCYETEWAHFDDCPYHEDWKPDGE